MRKYLLVTAWLFASACANQRAEREHLLSPQSQQLLGRYRQFMTQLQIDQFLELADDAGREQYCDGLRINERLAGYSKPIQDAIWSQLVISGMDKPAVLLSWGVPGEREFSNPGGNEAETWLYARNQHRYAVIITNGYVTDVQDQGVGR